MRGDDGGGGYDDDMNLDYPIAPNFMLEFIPRRANPSCSCAAKMASFTTLESVKDALEKLKKLRRKTEKKYRHLKLLEEKRRW